MAAVASNGTAVVTLPSDTEILITREMTIAEIDLRVGGTWRYVMIASGGQEVAFHGEYEGIIPNQRIVATEVYEGRPDAEASTTATFTEVDGRTTLVLRVQHSSREDRDAHVNSWMEDGLQDALDLLEQVASPAWAPDEDHPCLYRQQSRRP